MHKAKRAENLAVKILENAGYKVLEVQKRLKVKTKIDGKEYSNTIIADMIVQKGVKTYLVEIKTGKQVEKTITPLIRRQLLEYYLIYKPDGLILLNMETGKLHNISFNLEDSYRYKIYLKYTLAFLVGVITTYLLLSFR